MWLWTPPSLTSPSRWSAPPPRVLRLRHRSASCLSLPTSVRRKCASFHPPQRLGGRFSPTPGPPFHVGGGFGVGAIRRATIPPKETGVLNPSTWSSKQHGN